MKNKIRMLNYMIHYEQSLPNMEVRFWVYPVIDCTDSKTGIATTYYTADKDCGPIKFEEDSVRCLFAGTMTARGVWESRIYFQDEEYWGEEVGEMSVLLKEHIIPWSKELIKKLHPDPTYYDHYDTVSTETINADKVAEEFKKDVIRLCRTYGLSISHQDGHGAFQIVKFDEHYAKWFMQAANKQ